MHRPPPTPHTMLQALQHFAEQSLNMREKIYTTPELLIHDDGGAVRTSLEAIPQLRADMTWLATNPQSPLTDEQRGQVLEPLTGPRDGLDEIERSLMDILADPNPWTVHWTRSVIAMRLEQIDALPDAWSNIIHHNDDGAMA